MSLELNQKCWMDTARDLAKNSINFENQFFKKGGKL
jgi:hypothetical protein